MNFKIQNINTFIKQTLICFLFLVTSISIAQDNIFDVSRSGSLEDITKLYNQDNSSINNKNEKGYTPLTLACYSGNIEVVTFLADKVDDIDGNSNYGTPLMAAVYKNKIAIVEVLLKNKANPNIQDAQGGTAMHFAVLFKNYEIIKLLKDANANFNIKNNVEKSALDFAISFNDIKLNKILNINK